MKSAKISSWRIKFISFVFVVLLLFIVAFLFRWQIVEADRYKYLAKQRIKDTQLSSLRGRILDNDGAALAYSVPTYDLYAYLPEMNEAEELSRQTRVEFIRKVAPIINLEEEYLGNILAQNILYNVIVRDISVEQKIQLEKLKTDKSKERTLVGLHFEPSEKRVYPDKTLASHIIGFLGKNDIGEDVGRNGIEGYWNGDLAWKEGFFLEEIDSFGNQILTGAYEPILPKTGRTVQLTIDRGVQEILEDKIKEGVKKWDAESGTIVAMNPKTGAVKGMANYPTYDPGKYYKQKDFEVFRNKAVSDSYEFGSVGKVFTASAAIDTGDATPDSIIFEKHKGCIHVLEEKEICTSSKEAVNKPFDLTDVLAHSDNIGAFMTAEKLGADNMYSYLREFGIGSKTNVGLAEETTIFLKTPEKWNRADLAAYSYGQGYSATPLQITSAISAIANNGKRMQPFIVQKIYDDEEVMEIEPKVASQPLKKESAQIINSMMTEVFDRNGSKWYYKDLTNYHLAGKSGTASVLDISGKSYAQDKVNVTFVGWDSSRYKTFVMLIRLEKPEGAPFSVESVQPLWMETFLEVKDALGVVPIVR